MPREYDYQYGRGRTKDDNAAPAYQAPPTRWPSPTPGQGVPAYQAPDWWGGIMDAMRRFGEELGRGQRANELVYVGGQAAPRYEGPLVGLTNDETRRTYDTPLVRYTNDSTRPTKERQPFGPTPAEPEQGYAPEFFGPTESLGGGQMSALSPGEGFPEWTPDYNEREGGGYGRGGYAPYERYNYNYSPGYEAPKPQPRRYDYGLTTWKF